WAHYFKDVGSIVLLFAGAAFVVFVAFGQFRKQPNTPTSEQPLRSDLYSDQLPPDLYSDHLYRIARLAVAASVLLSVMLAAVLVFVEPPRACPGWHLPNQRSDATWLPGFMFTVLLGAVLIFMIVRWRWLIRKAIEKTDDATTIP